MESTFKVATKNYPNEPKRVVREVSLEEQSDGVALKVGDFYILTIKNGPPQEITLCGYVPDMCGILIGNDDTPLTRKG